ncbi:hypothetical protein [Erythrobacter sp. YT30]|uniref:hypothetical protein n=1 Tax=Erythrobacter sp. YT30 TaxID=1735012 RepID=UPI00076BC70F|nr:hypothetical protein [Erythrobacter sp. YT30]KWV90840.1 hypothetical protein AUC45_05700 [Erythrobacter sp. YT30]
MRAIADFLDNLTTAVRAIFALFMLCMIVFGYIMSQGVSRIASSAADDAATSIAESNEQRSQLKAKRAQERDLAEDDWGYDASDPDNDWGAE